MAAPEFDNLQEFPFKPVPLDLAEQNKVLEQEQRQLGMVLDINDYRGVVGSFIDGPNKPRSGNPSFIQG